MKKGETDSLFTLCSGSGSRSKTKGIEPQILEELENNNYHTQRQTADMIKDKFSISISLPAAVRFLKKGIKRLKNGSLPAKADAVRQRGFYDDTLKPLMDKAADSKEVLLFLDASHFVMGCDYPGFIYGKVRRFVKSFSGRMRYNVPGAIDFVTKEVVTVTSDTYITATQVCEMLRTIPAKYTDKTIHPVLDNARYQKCKAVQDLAKELCIDLVYIPPYSPDINLIERLWKFVKSELRTKYYDDFTEFCDRIDQIIAGTSTNNNDKISKLIGSKVQLFDDLKQINPNTFVDTKPGSKKSQGKKLVA